MNKKQPLVYADYSKGMSILPNEVLCRVLALTNYSCMKKCISLIACLLLLNTCFSQADSVKVKPKVVHGVASFYSRSLEGTQTATGEIFHHNEMTGASNNFKLNTWVRVTNLRNDKSVIVRINDRMHKKMAKKGRVVDLTRSAAKKLGFLSRGLTKVVVEAVPEGTEE